MSDVGWARTTVGTGPPSVVVFQGVERALPDVVRRWVASLDARVERVTTDDGLMALVMRGRPLVVLVDARGAAHGEFAGAVAAIGRTKADAFTGVIPLAAITDSAERTAVLLNAGADEAVATSASEAEWEARLGALMRRSTRDMGVHPTTRLPGTTEIEARLERCIAAGVSFATCYADLDHFKEFNDRYGYNEGDRVIRMVALILHDVVAGATGEGGFVGHIGGDDFIFIVPLDVMPTVCELVVETFELARAVPVQRGRPARRLLFRQGPSGHVAPRAADEPVHRRGDERAARVHSSVASQRPRVRDEELCEGADRFRVFGRSPQRATA